MGSELPIYQELRYVRLSPTLDQDMARQLVNPAFLFLQLHRLHQVPPQRPHVPVDLPQSRLLQIAPPLGELVDRQLLRRRAMDVIRQILDSGRIRGGRRDKDFGG